MSRRALLLLLTMGFGSVPSITRAITNDSASIALHLAPVSLHNQCSTTLVAPACSNIVTNGDLVPHYYFAYLLVTHGDPVRGITGVQCGIRYNPLSHQGVDVYTWNLCATLDFQSQGWPNSGGGTLITWDSTHNCQRFEPGGAGTGVVAVAGYFYLGAYSADRMDVIPRPVDGIAKVADCNAVEYVLESGVVHRSPSPLGSLLFSAGGTVPGYNPCDHQSGGNCEIAGPLAAEIGETGLLFSATGAVPGDQFAWTISGNGSIVGAADGPQVSVTAGAIGTFQLGLDLTHNSPPHVGSVSTCWTIVTVGPPTCLIEGPSTIVEGMEGVHYSVSRITPQDGIHWSIAGNGVITSGLTDTEVTVNATAPGALVLSVASDGNTITCQRSVAVITVPCTITGPDQVLSHQVNLGYAAEIQVPGSTYAWTLTGNGALTGPVNGPAVRVTAGNPGAFALHLTVSRSGLPHLCHQSFTVIDAGSCAASQASARILIHLRPTTTRTACGAWGEPACVDVKTAGALYPTTYFGYLLVCNGSALAGVAGLECGLEYDDAPQAGVDIYSWALCATLDFRTADWPAAGSGNRITWDPQGSCQRNEPGGPGTGVTANAGYFYMAAYTPDQIAVRPHPLTGEAKVADCTACESVLAESGVFPYVNLGLAQFSAGGNSAGFNPCGSVVPVMKSTWGSIKAIFGDRTPTPR